MFVLCLKADTFMKMFRPLKQIWTDEFKKCRLIAILNLI